MLQCSAYSNTTKKNCFIFQTVAAIAAKQRGVGLHISYIHDHLSDGDHDLNYTF
jgi:hypothetical protein